ncbi:MAG: U32 family peptidase [Bacilli bacterium]|nr:U32 family peptidase [Bacilli bacterium]
MRRHIELLAPAGDYSSFVQAINNGADAIYLSLDKFGARAYATNFKLEEVIKLIKIAHILNVKIYVTVNTLIKDNEMEECIHLVKALYENDCDAILVQDLGLAYLCKKLFPNLSLHASTQMNINTVEKAKKIKELGFKRIVLARECSIEEIKKIKENVDIELEVFAHGALCMSYSGNCLMSSFIGKRSGNRGRCAGACRQKYEIYKNDKKISDDKYYLSLNDLSTYNYIDEFINAGVDSIKLEGRVKRKEYVGLITKVYRDAIDKKLAKDPKYQLQEMFNRGTTKGFVFNDTNENMSNINYPNHMGVKLGHVIKSLNNYVFIKLDEMDKSDVLELGDSIRIFNDKDEDGITISKIDLYNDKLEMINNKKASYNAIIGLRCHKKLNVGMEVIKTSTKALMDEFSDEEINKKMPIKAIIYSKNNKLGLELRYQDEEINVKVNMLSSDDLQEAKSDYLERIKAQVDKLNDTYFYFEKLDIKMNNAYLSVSKINELRRNCISLLEEEILKARSKYLHEEKVINKIKYEKLEESINDEIKLFVKINTKEQYDACKALNIKYIITENELIKDLEDVKYMNDRIGDDNGKCEEYKLSSPYLNVFNAYSAAFMKMQGNDIIGLSVEMSKDEIKDLIDNYKNHYKSNPNLLMLVYGRIEAMIMKHCLINKYCGFKHKNCMECVNNNYYLKDKMNYKFPLIRSNDCNLKLLNSSRLHLLKYLDEIIDMGINNIMLDFTIESYLETYDIIDAYLHAIKKEKYELDIDDYNYGQYLKGIE